MLTREQADRIADAIQVVRPAWDHNEILKVLGNDDIRIRRVYEDTFHAALAIALDPDTNHPSRLLAAGPWWNSRPSRVPNATEHLPKSHHDDCRECGKPADHEWHQGRGTVFDCDYLRPDEYQPVPPPAEIRQLVKTKKVHP